MASQDIWRIYDSGGSEDDTMIWVAVIGFVAGIISGM